MQVRAIQADELAPSDLKRIQLLNMLKAQAIDEVNAQGESHANNFNLQNFVQRVSEASYWAEQSAFHKVRKAQERKEKEGKIIVPGKPNLKVPKGMQ